MSISLRSKTTKTEFSPLFIVGAPRSGTTMLSVLLDRHSKIAIPPETQFFSEFRHKHPINYSAQTHEQIVDIALSFKRIADLKLERHLIVERYQELEKNEADLLRAILETYTASNHKEVSGEKSPKHLEYVDEIFNAFPNAKVICIVRDGRDVVRSLLKVPWAEPGNPRRFELFCMEWTDLARKTIEFSKRFSSKRLMIVKYENILKNPTDEIQKLMKFIGETFEESQLDNSVQSDVVPAWENNWKGKASQTLDPGRISAWKKDADENQIWYMNNRMGRMLRKMGYGDTELNSCPWLIRFKIFCSGLPYKHHIRPLSLLGMKVLKNLKVIEK